MQELEILDRENPIAGNLPFSTMTVAVNTPSERIPSHGTDEWGQRYAYDLVPVVSGDSPKASSKDLYLKGSMFQQTLFGVPVEKFQAWGQDIHSPFAGTIVSVQDGWEDRARPWLPKEIIRSVFFTKPPEGEDIRSLAGNNVVIKTEHGYLFLAHFQKDSIQVDIGDFVLVGQKLGLVGNSGNSTMPHLHIHLMDGPDAKTAKGIPFAFHNLERAIGGGKWEKLEVSFLESLSRFRRTG
jgi:hypothetical protein